MKIINVLIENVIVSIFPMLLLLISSALTIICSNYFHIFFRVLKGPPRMVHSLMNIIADIKGECTWVWSLRNSIPKIHEKSSSSGREASCFIYT